MRTLAAMIALADGFRSDVMRQLCGIEARIKWFRLELTVGLSPGGPEH
jgi:hypothetical protein